MKRIVYPPAHGRCSSRQRRRLCRGCHLTATHAEVEQRPAATLHLDGSIDRFLESVAVYWCGDHTGISAARP